jgi:putative nucleotidyltransferase with HDIG domain
MNDYELIIVKGNKKGLRFPLQGETTTIGRSVENSIILEDDMVSRKHCIIKRDTRSNFMVQDLDSKNKTLINGMTVLDKNLIIGDHIQVGDTVFLFTSVKEEERFLEKEKNGTATKIINVTELKIVPDENKLLNLMETGGNVEELRRAHRDLATVYKLGSLISSIQDTAELLNTLVDKLIEVLQPNRVVLMLFGDGRGKIVNKIIKTLGPADKDIADISMSMVHEAVKEGLSILSYDALTDNRFKDKQSVILNKIRSAMCTPVKVRGNVLGVLYLDTNIGAGKFSEQDLQLLSIIGNQAGIAIQNAKLYEDMNDLFTGSLKTLVATIEAKDNVTSGHSLRVTKISRIIAEEMGLNKEGLRILEISALLHDIGKVGVPESILGKPAPLNENEFIRMREHSARGAEIIKNIKNVEEVVTAVRHHHERFDGSGVPDGLKGESIPLLSRIIAVADAFDAMTYDRPYRKGVAIERAAKEIEKWSGTQFDPKVVAAFVRAYNNGMIGAE